MSNYLILVKEDNIFKFKTYCGNFRDFLEGYRFKIYFKIRLPRIIGFKNGFNNNWYKRFCEDFYFLHKSGVPIIESIRIFKENAISSKSKKDIRFYSQVYDNLLNGNSLYDSFKLTNNNLDPIFSSLIQVSDEVGKLADILKNLSDYYEEKINITNNIKSAFIYPSLLFSILIVLFNLCILFFIPSYVNSFQSQISNLPPLSIAFINICMFIKNNYLIFLLVTLLIFLFMFGSITSSKRRQWISKLHIFKKFYLRRCQLKFVQTLYYIVNSGIDIPTGLKIMSDLDNECSTYSKYIYYQINEGFDFCESLRNTKIFDVEVISIISVGEKSSNINSALRNIWTSYSKRYYGQLQKSTKLVEPIFILVCGVLVLIFVVVFILPLISYDNFSHIWGV